MKNTKVPEHDRGRRRARLVLTSHESTLVARLAGAEPSGDGSQLLDVLTMRVVNPAALTPVETHGDYRYKRDDLFVPFDDMPVSGGKVRQAMLLLARQRQRIVDDFDGLVLTASGVHSPQGLIVARAAVALGLRCIVFCGGDTSPAATAMRHPVMRRVLEVGAQLDSSSKLGYEGPLAATIKRYRDEHDGAGYVVKFGINLEDDPSAVLDSTAAQCANVPPDVETIVVPVGAGITAAGIILGVREHCRPDLRVVCVQIAGLDRRDTIDRIVGATGGYEWHELHNIPYSKLVLRRVGGFTLDPIYEAKAHDFMLRHDDVCPPGSLFWIVGDSTAVRRVGATRAVSA